MALEYLSPKTYFISLLAINILLIYTLFGWLIILAELCVVIFQQNESKNLSSNIDFIGDVYALDLHSFQCLAKKSRFNTKYRLAKSSEFIRIFARNSSAFLFRTKSNTQANTILIAIHFIDLYRFSDWNNQT